MMAKAGLKALQLIFFFANRKAREKLFIIIESNSRETRCRREKGQR